jgi:hypothetical protein
MTDIEKDYLITITTTMAPYAIILLALVGMVG